MLRQIQVKPIPMDQLLFWIILTVFTSVYFFLYDTFYLSREISFFSTLISTSQAWAIWLLLMPVIFQCVKFDKAFSFAVLKRILLIATGCITVSMMVQWLIFSKQADINYTLLFCYLPANVKIMGLLLLLTWHQSKTKKQPVSPKSTLRCQNQKSEVIDVAIENISHIQADGNYLQIHTDLGTLIKRATISQTEQLLSAHGFIRIHRSYLINKNQIERLNSKYVNLKNGFETPIGRTFQTTLKKLFVEFD